MVSNLKYIQDVKWYAGLTGNERILRRIESYMELGKDLAGEDEEVESDVEKR